MLKQNWKRIASLTLALMLFFALSISTYASGSNQVIADSRNGVVRIIMEGPYGGPWDMYTGSGFGVGTVGEETDIFATNAHVVSGYYLVNADNEVKAPYPIPENEEFAFVQEEPGDYVAELPAVRVWIVKNNTAWDPWTKTLDTAQCVPCEILYYEEGQYPDIAVLKAAEPVAGRVALPLQADEDTLEVADSIFALGYPGLSDVTETGIYGQQIVAGVEDITISSGVVSRFSTSETLENTRVIQHDAVINGGNSGGPLLNAEGVVVGLNTYGLSNTYYSVRIKYITDKLDDLGIDYETDADMVSDNGGFNIGIIGIIAVAAVGVVVLFVLLMKNNKSTPAPVNPVPASVPMAAPVTPTMGVAYSLRCIKGSFSGQVKSISKTLRMGRDPVKNDWVFSANTKGISAAHCAFMEEGGQLYLMDCGSTYGTFLNGRKLTANQSVKVNNGDTITLGSDNEAFVVVKGGN